MNISLRLNGLNSFFIRQGPLRFPSFGNLIQIGLENKIAHIALHNLAKKYGDVMSVKMGLVETGQRKQMEYFYLSIL